MITLADPNIYVFKILQTLKELEEYPEYEPFFSSRTPMRNSVKLWAYKGIA